MKNQIITKVKEALALTLKLDPSENLDAKTKLKEELGLDSMTSLTFLMTLEDSIANFSVDPDTLETNYLETVETVADYVLQELKRTENANN